jgi:hypothetical protein
MTKLSNISRRYLQINVPEIDKSMKLFNDIFILYNGTRRLECSLAKSSGGLWSVAVIGVSENCSGPLSFTFRQVSLTLFFNFNFKKGQFIN